MRKLTGTLLMGCLLAGGIAQANAQANMRPSNDTPPTADKAVQQKEDSKTPPPLNTNKSIPNVKADQPDQAAPTAPPAMAPTGQTSDKVPNEQKPKMHQKHMHHARHKANPPG